MENEVKQTKELKMHMREYIDWHLGNLPPLNRAMILWNVLRTWERVRTNYMGDRFSCNLQTWAKTQIELEFNEWGGFDNV